MKFSKQVAIGLLVVLAVFAGLPSLGQGQEKKDPTNQSEVIKQTLSKIRDVERLDTFVQQNNALKEENKKLKADIAQHQ